MFVFTFVARLFTFQYDRPHFEPLLRLPPNRARTHIESPIMFRVIKLFHVGDSTTKLSACVACASYFQHHGISLFISRHSEGKPSEPPFAEGKSPPFLPCCYAATGGLQERLAPMPVYTYVARLDTFQHDRPHLEPLLRPPPNRATLTPSA